MTSSWKHMVMVRLVIPFIAGILLADKLLSLVGISWLIPILALLLIVLSLPFQLPFAKRHIHGFFAAATMIVLGFALHTRNSKEQSFQEYYPPTSFLLEVQSEPIVKENSVQFTATIIEHDSIELVHKPILVYVSKPYNHSITRKDKIVVQATITKISGPKNPGEFNYQTFMERQGIHLRTFVSKDYIIPYAASTTKSMLSSIKDSGKNFINTYVRQDNRAIANALLLGLKKELDQETRETFTRAGTMHILAVSGLHVGIIFLLINGFLGFVQRYFKVLKPIKPFIIIVCIWLFALLTGASPSVLRAALMFTLFAIGWAFFPYVNSLNILAAAALLLLAYNSQLLFTVSFQLSFAAVAGILLILPFLRKKFAGGHRIWRYFKDIIFMSIAAQLATLPISIYYFHQFPALGLLSNLYAIPLAFAVVASGFLGIIFQGVPFIAALFGAILDASIYIIDGLNTFISDQTFSVVEQIGIHPIQVLLLFILIGSLCYYIAKPNGKKLLLGLSSIALLLLSFAVLAIQWNNRTEIMVHDAKNKTLLQLITNQNALLISDTLMDENYLSYSIEPYHTKQKIKNVNTINWLEMASLENQPIRNNGNLIQFENRLIQYIKEPKATLSIYADVIIWENPFNKSLVENKAWANKIVVTGRWPSRSQPLHDSIYFVKRDGAFVIK